MVVVVHHHLDETRPSFSAGFSVFEYQESGLQRLYSVRGWIYVMQLRLLPPWEPYTTTQYLALHS